MKTKTKSLFLSATLLIFSMYFGHRAFAAGSATINLSQDSSSYKVGQTFNVGISVDPVAGKIDMARVKLTFPSDLLEIKSFTPGSIFSFQAGGNGFDNSAGTFSWGAGISGGTTTTSNFGTITFNVKKIGLAQIAISNDSLVLASGVNEFNGKLSSVSYNLLVAAVAPVASKTSPKHIAPAKKVVDIQPTVAQPFEENNTVQTQVATKVQPQNFAAALTGLLSFTEITKMAAIALAVLIFALLVFLFFKVAKKKKIIIALLIFISVAQFAKAASDTSIVIQPSSTDISASPNQKLAKNFSIINRSNFSVTLKLAVKDYKQVSDSGQLQFYNATKESAAEWLVPQYLQVSLKPLETKDIGFVVNVPKDFSGGGHYGAILFEPVNNTQNISMENFGELVLLTVTGTGTKASAIVNSVNFSTGLFQQGNPVDFSFKMQNTGNTQYETQGKLVLKDWLGKEVGNYDLGALTVYPKTSRLFQWRWNGTPLIGIYQANVLFSNLNTNNKFSPVDGMWFVLFPWEAVLAIFAVCAIIFATVKYLASKKPLRKFDGIISVPIKKI